MGWFRLVWVVGVGEVRVGGVSVGGCMGEGVCGCERLLCCMLCVVVVTWSAVAQAQIKTAWTSKVWHTPGRKIWSRLTKP